jgi:hypothetical protein
MNSLRILQISHPGPDASVDVLNGISLGPVGPTVLSDPGRRGGGRPGARGFVIDLQKAWDSEAVIDLQGNHKIGSFYILRRV